MKKKSKAFKNLQGIDLSVWSSMVDIQFVRLKEG